MVAFFIHSVLLYCLNVSMGYPVRNKPIKKVVILPLIIRSE